MTRKNKSWHREPDYYNKRCQCGSKFEQNIGDAYEKFDLCEMCRDKTQEELETAAILERLEECYLESKYGAICIADNLKVEKCPLDSNEHGAECELCQLHYIKTGKMITEEDMKEVK